MMRDDIQRIIFGMKRGGHDSKAAAANAVMEIVDKHVGRMIAEANRLDEVIDEQGAEIKELRRRLAEYDRLMETAV